MNPQLEIAILSAASALLGSIVGGLLSYLTTRHLKHQEWQQTQLEEQIAKREDLYSAFLTESSRIHFGALDKRVEKAIEFAELYTLTGKMQMISSLEVIEAARALSKEAWDDYSDRERQKSEEEQDRIYKLRTQFTQHARKEIDQLRRKA